MSLIIKAISSLIITILVTIGVSNMTETTPQQAAEDFFAGLTGDNQQVMSLYADNQYVNFLENVKGSDEEMDRLEAALFRNFSYKITDTAIRGDIAVCKVQISNCDFSSLFKKYEKVSYKYVMDNLYSEKVTDKEQLNKKCLDIYIEQAEKISGSEPSYNEEVFLPMEDNGYIGWHIVLSNEIMQSILGGLSMPAEKAQTIDK